MKLWSALLVFLVGATTVVACGSGDDSAFVPNDAGNGDATIGTGDDAGTFVQPDGPTSGFCTPRTCADANVTCGPAGDGCGGLLQCGTCTAPDTCGGGGTPSKCGGGTTQCKPKTCADFPATSCGPLADGCGGLITCGANGGKCTPPQLCGGGGTASVCGGNSGCVPKTAVDCTNLCGPIADGCGGSVDCGSCAGANESCGAGGPSKCGIGGVNPDGGPLCTPKTCGDLGFTCGPAGDGCGGLLDCGTCQAPQTCGGGGQPSKCGGSSACIPKTCAQLGAGCGPIGDGCGGVLQCGTCQAPQTCGGAGTPSVCGGNNACVPKTCANYPANTCGPVADGCGGVLTNCGVGDAANCPAPSICGGGGTASVCGGGAVDAGADAGCTGLCLQQVTCTNGGVTAVTGTVRAPTTAAYLPSGGVADPIPNAVVYVPNAPVQDFGAGVSCDKCGADVSGSPLVKAFTGPDGKFTLTNMPVGNNIPIVIQLGRWRRQIHVNVTACTAQPQQLTNDQTRLPRWEHEGDQADNIPLTAIATGAVDSLECVLRKIGVDDREFTAPAGTGRIRMYWNNGAFPPSGTVVPMSTLVGTDAELAKYDQILFPCEGSQTTRATADENRVINYTNIGGRMFDTHFSYTWLFDDAPFSGTGTWVPDPNVANAPPNPLTANIDTSFTKGATFAQWLGLVGALSSTNPPQISINVPRHDLDAPLTNSQQWITSDPTTGYNESTIQHYTFNTPVGAASTDQCGRVVFSDFHVNNAAINCSEHHHVITCTSYPNECAVAPLTAQEKVLEYMLFDLASCISPDKPPTPPTCTKQTCQSAGATCGVIGDGCGGTIDCGQCIAPQTCGGGGTANQCGGTGCTPRTCVQQGFNCGPAGDGCGNQLDCGQCVAPQTCGGGGVPGQCGNPSCIGMTCQQQGFDCGPAGDGCGGLLQCGTCVAPQVCGGGGSAGVCGNSVCTKLTCQAQNADCGPVADGCGGLLQCGTCPPGQVCGGGGPSKCGASSCTPRTCQQVGANCGPIGDGCGGSVDCGPCTQPGQTCGGGGTANVCGGCTPTTCQAAGAQCGPIGDGCGGFIDCGSCTSPDTCGGGGTPFVCGHPAVK